MTVRELEQSKKAGKKQDENFQQCVFAASIFV
jgi:hypothetical protein